MALRGFYGGTFDPIHQGHLQLALFVQQYCQLQQLDIVPCHIPPHRQQPGSSSEHRAAMVKLAIANHPQLQLNTVELQQNRPSYTVQTLQQLKLQYPNDSLCFVIGMDSLQQFKRWHQWPQILTLCHLLVLQRPGYTQQQADAADLLAQHQLQHLSQLTSQAVGGILLLPNPHYAIAATQIRAELQQADASALLQIPAVQAYIKQHQLYR